jgi:ribosomal protein S18 acetylase RimI-like enzyme
MSGVTILRGLPRHQRTAAAGLYWQAFGGKLGRVLGPDARALTFLERVIRPDHAIVALDAEGRMLGLAGFKTPQGSFAGGTRRDLSEVYGPFGGLWRAALLRLLQREVDNARFLMDGLCVAREARGQGVGSLLVEAICREAQARAYAEVRLDVIDSNWRARALYERLGFEVVGEESLGPLRHVFGFRSAKTMVRRVE